MKNVVKTDKKPKSGLALAFPLFAIWRPVEVGCEKSNLWKVEVGRFLELEGVLKDQRLQKSSLIQ